MHQNRKQSKLLRHKATRKLAKRVPAWVSIFMFLLYAACMVGWAIVAIIGFALAPYIMRKPLYGFGGIFLCLLGLSMFTSNVQLMHLYWDAIAVKIFGD